MKKFILVFTLLVGSFAFAEETVLFSADKLSSANYDEYSFDNFTVTSTSGNFKKSNLHILKPTDSGLPVMAENVPQYISTHYEVNPAYPTFLNNANEGIGYIENARNIKSVKLVATTNRPYDEIILLYSYTPNGKVYEIKMPNNTTIYTMEEFTLTYDIPTYESDVTKRVIKNLPIVNNEINGIYLRGFRIQTNAPFGQYAYSPYSVVMIKEVTLIYDNAVTSEQLQKSKEIKEQFGISTNSELENKTKKMISEKKRLLESELKLMDSTQISDVR